MPQARGEQWQERPGLTLGAMMHTPPFFTNISGGKSGPGSEFPGLEPHSQKSGLGLSCAGQWPQLPWLGKYHRGGWDLRVHAWLKETWFMEEKE